MGADGPLYRTGQVLGWTGNLIAVASVGLGVAAYNATTSSHAEIFLYLGAGIAVLAWLIGRGLRYIFSGE
jgi:hypothetical protein